MVVNIFKNKFKKIISFFLTLITLSFVIIFSNISDGYSFNVCQQEVAGVSYGAAGDNEGKSAQGAILVKDEGSGDITSFALASNPDVYTFGGSEDACDITPDHYKITIHKFGLCVENPYREPEDDDQNTINADLEECILLYESATGKELDIEPDSELSLFDGEVTIPVGSYKYPFIVADNHIHIKHIQKFITHDGTDATLKGYHASDNNKFTDLGTACYTGKDSGGNIWINTLTFELQAGSADPAVTTLHGTTLPTAFTGTPTATRLRCGTIDEAIAGNDYTTTIINSFGAREWQSTSSVDTDEFRNATGCCNSNASVPGVEQAFYLLKDDNETIADTQENARRVLMIQMHDDPIKITEETIGFKLNFKTNNAVNVRIYQEEDSGGENRDELLMGTVMLANELYIDIQTKTKRRRGAWR